MINQKKLKVIECTSLPNLADFDPQAVYRLLPVNFDRGYYNERTDRNNGWITPEEQELLLNSIVPVAGCGGMGGLVAATLVRLGVGEIRFADPEVFDVSNLNRQFGAFESTVGVSKAYATVELVRKIARDTTLVMYPQGIDETTVDHFLAGCKVACDEIEGFAVGARVLLHQRARAQGVELLAGNTVGHRTYAFRFTPDSMPLEEILGFDYEKAKNLQMRIQSGAANREEIRRVIDSMVKAFIPEVPEYATSDDYSTVEAFYRRFEEGKGPIIATNPPMASGFLANRVLLQVLRDSGVKRDAVEVPKMPGYLSFDAATMEATCVTEKWW